MTESGSKILRRFKRHWQLKVWIEIILYALGASILAYFLSQNLIYCIGVFSVVCILVFIFFKPQNINLQIVIRYIDKQLVSAENSTGLLLMPQEHLSSIARLQRYKVENELNQNLKTIKPPDRLIRGAIVLGVLTFIGFVVHQFNLVDDLNPSRQIKVPEERIIFTPTDSSAIKTPPPILKSQLLTIEYPKYTRTASFQTSDMEVKALEGSKLTWQIKFDREIESVTMESMGNSYPMKFIKGKYTRTSTATSSGFYSFRFIDEYGVAYVSKLYAIEVQKDQKPVLEIKGLKQFTSFSFDANKNLAFNTLIKDDFGVANAYIIATVSKGSGESVKFREERLGFDTGVVIGGKKQNLFKNINLNLLKMEPGDELYFYVEALDQKHPKPNISRSETFFAVIKDTITDRFAVEGTMGVDLMPDYFRSQRQLIIDTEKLLKDKPKLLSQEFKFKSNELGFDQKVLRLKYAEFMGDESEFTHTPGESEETHDHEEDHDHDHEEEDPLAAYTHKHDSENEHNLVEEDGKKEDPLEEYLHNHDDPEESTLFTKSLKSMLRQALNEMWDAELHLRLYQPEKSLPYQYRALKLIQKIKNSARIYVHRIGFDPPPIKADKRLTGKINEVKGYQKREEVSVPVLHPNIRKTILRLETLIQREDSITDIDKVLFKQAGNELAEIAIENPGKYLETLQKLKQITEIKETPESILIDVQKGLYPVLPQAYPNPVKIEKVNSDINQLLLKELEIND
ncbi:tryptophan-rich sensory protein [Aquimarina gracilis]|uniref:Tryptophan-rich sensory protein n=1 Tax=Aquimarina gracilis TaxID=874422 RepID=A0ABU5ZUU7_9FLAO|nr:tryptophan-rich sensory protein [Aquimarina gracilis]MEB3345804.1 tryptophan-rich sensory protein [Aquimarina gracilis]